jgi:hypothetical protein
VETDARMYVTHRTDFLAAQALNVNVCEEGDPIITCAFKTELVTVLLTLTRAAIAVNIGPT